MVQSKAARKILVLSSPYEHGDLNKLFNLFKAQLSHLQKRNTVLSVREPWRRLKFSEITLIRYTAYRVCVIPGN